MLPKKLSIQGLYSYQNKAEIDFENLTSAGLFGIFGAVGSGKSSILEAIGFALYGQTERLGLKDTRAYNMMNLKSNSLSIVFDFENYDGKFYRFEAKARRNSKRFEDVGTIERNAFLWENDQWMPLSSADAAHYIHLSYENFRRTIIIPQGKFQEFLQLTAGERTKMLLDIFQLERFDLSDNIGKLMSENKHQLDIKNGALSQYENKNSEQLVELKQQSAQVQTEILTFSERQKAKEIQVKELVDLAKIFDALHATQKEYESLQAQSPDFETRKQNLQVYETAKLEFESLISNRNNIANKIQERQKLISQLQIDFSNIQSENKDLTAAFVPIQKSNDALDEQRALLHEYDFAVSILKNEKEIELQKGRQAKGQKFVNDKDLAIQASEKSIKDLDAQISLLEKDADNLDVYFQIQNWWDTRNSIEKDLDLLTNKSDKIKSELLKNELAFEKLGYKVSDWQAHIISQKQALEIQITENQQQANQIAVRTELQTFATNLEEGIPCPLCGATHHPDVLQAENISKHSQAINQQTEALNTQMKELKSIENQLNQLFISYKSQENLFTQNTQETQDKREILAKHLTKFTWGNFDNNDIDSFQLSFEKVKSASENLKKLRVNWNTEKANFQKLQDVKHKYSVELASIEQNIENLRAQIIQDSSHLQQLKLADFTQKDLDELNAEKDNLNKQITQVVADFKLYSDRIKANETALTKAESSLISQQQELTQNEKERTDVEYSLQEKLKQSTFENMEEVIAILNNAIDIPKERSIIEAFNKQLHTLATQLATFHEQVKGKDFNANDLEKAQLELAELNEKITELQKQNGNLSGQIKQLTEDLQTKETLGKEVNSLQLRQENINTLFNLFKGQGFVNYISSVYLQQLCQSANSRFFQLTNNHLQLDLNDKNEFIVIDYMNEGKYRSVKTLSGGQTFQAALCLALALADSVQANKSDQQNFFFLDEGFGSLDKNSLNIVFETLKSLRKEHRIVGVISHVEELQQEIPISLFVKNDPETGSYLTLNND